MENAAVHNGLRALELLFARPGRDGVMALPEDPLLERLRGAFLAASEKPVSGRAAAVKLGRLPFLQSPYSVNCDTTKIPPPTSYSDRFILSFSSVNTRSLTVLSAR